MTGNAQLPADSAARRRALDVGNSFTVAAPAGSGKTGLLTQRLLALLATVAAPEQILCMTFTRKAASEMRRRVLQALTRARDDTPPADAYERDTWTLARQALAHGNARNWQLLDAPNRLRILTIDGFCRDLARQLAVHSGFGELPEPTEDADRHYRTAARELLAELDARGADSATADALETLLGHLDNDLPRLEGMLMRLLARREQWLGHVLASRDARPVLEGYLAGLRRETLAAAAQLLAPVASDIARLADYAASNLADSGHLLTACKGLTGLPTSGIGTAAAELERDQWLGIIELLTTKGGDWRKTINVTLGFPAARGPKGPEGFKDPKGSKDPKGARDPGLAAARKQLWEATLDFCRRQPGLRAALDDVRALPAATYDDAQWQVLAALTRLLPRLVARLRLVFRREHSCDFNEIALAALAALGDDDHPTDLVLSLDSRIQHILVDECQDTSSVQFALLRRLTAGWQPGDGRTLFLVGDGMQSLYGFRNANVGLFLDAGRHPVGGAVPAPLALTANFRSQAGVVGWVNRLFASAFPAVADASRGAVPYAPAQAVQPPLTGPAVTVDLFRGPPDSAAEAEAVAAGVLAAQAENPTGSIAILVRGRAHLREILPALHRRGLRWQATDIDPLATRMPVLDLLSLTRALLCPAERIAWLAVLRAPWCGLDLGDLHALANPTASGSAPADAPTGQPARGGERYPLLLAQILHHRNVHGLSAAGRRILARVGAVFAAAWGERRRRPLRTWVEGVWIALGGPAALVDVGALADCQQYLDLLERQADSGGSGTIDDWPAFVAAVGRLYAAPHAAPAPGAEPGLQIMTIHKAKGLEFDTVILPGLHRVGRNNDAELLLWAERVSAAGRAELLLAAPHRIGADDDPLYRYLKREGHIKARLEATRVLYVACTRAVRRLHLLLHEPAKGKPASDSLLAPLWPALAEELAAPPAELAVRIHDNPATGAASGAVDVDSEEEAGVVGAPATPTFSLRLPAAWQPPAPLAVATDAPPPISAATISAATIPAANVPGSPAEPDAEPGGAPDARHLGTLLHRALRQVVLDTAAAWDEARIERQKPAWAIQLRELGVADIEAALNRIEAALRHCLDHPHGRWLLDHRHPASACELALGYIDSAGHQRTAVLDRTFVADGTRWIIDYKSATPAAGEPRSRFLARQREQYRQQLADYARLFARADRPPVRVALYYPLLPHLDVVDLDPDS